MSHDSLALHRVVPNPIWRVCITAPPRGTTRPAQHGFSLAEIPLPQRQTPRRFLDRSAVVAKPVNQVLRLLGADSRAHRECFDRQQIAARYLASLRERGGGGEGKRRLTIDFVLGRVPLVVAVGAFAFPDLVCTMLDFFVPLVAHGKSSCLDCTQRRPGRDDPAPGNDFESYVGGRRFPAVAQWRPLPCGTSNIASSDRRRRHQVACVTQCLQQKN
jgi:hypothetical protein